MNHGLIVSNLRISRTKVPQTLRAVRKTIEPKVAVRNEIVHRHSYSDPLFRRLELFYMQTEASWASSSGKLQFKNLAHMRARMMKQATTSKRAEFEALNIALVRTLAPLFTELHLRYEKQKAGF